MALVLAKANARSDVLGPEDLLGRVAVVGAAEHPEIRRVGWAASPLGQDVIELEPTAFVAASPVGRGKRAALAVAREDLSARRRRHARARGGSCSLLPRPLRLAEPSILQLADEQVEGALDDHREISARVLVAHEIARSHELVAQRRAGGELHAIAA